VWSERPSRAFPYVHLYMCRNQLVRFFPNTTDRLERETETASTMWFIDGGAHVRLYYRGSLPATDAACADVPDLYRPRLASPHETRVAASRQGACGAGARRPAIEWLERPSDGFGWEQVRSRPRLGRATRP
jgi:hypothetical protein